MTPQPTPLSYPQQQLWIIHKLEGPAATYNIPLALTLRGELDRAALAAAFRDLLARHVPLRARIAEADGTPGQVIADPPAPDRAMTVVAVRARRARPALARGAAHRFDLAAEPPVRATLFAVGPDTHVLLIVLHHIAADGWSLRPIARDLSAAYAARRASEAPAWPPLPAEYPDYVAWQREMLGDEADTGSLLARQLGHWRRALAGLPGLLSLPLDRPRLAAASYRGEQVRVRLDAGLHAEIADLARRSGGTVFMVLQAALAALLTRLGAGCDIPIGTAVAGRTDEALEELVGCFVNTLVLRTDTGGNPTFSELLGRVRETALAAYANSDVPFQRVVEAVNPGRSLAPQSLVPGHAHLARGGARGLLDARLAG